MPLMLTPEFNDDPNNEYRKKLKQEEAERIRKNILRQQGQKAYNNDVMGMREIPDQRGMREIPDQRPSEYNDRIKNLPPNAPKPRGGRASDWFVPYDYVGNEDKYNRLMKEAYKKDFGPKASSGFNNSKLFNSVPMLGASVVYDELYGRNNSIEGYQNMFGTQYPMADTLTNRTGMGQSIANQITMQSGGKMRASPEQIQQYQAMSERSHPSEQQNMYADAPTSIGMQGLAGYGAIAGGPLTAATYAFGGGSYVDRIIDDVLKTAGQVGGELTGTADDYSYEQAKKILNRERSSQKLRPQAIQQYGDQLAALMYPSYGHEVYDADMNNMEPFERAKIDATMKYYNQAKSQPGGEQAWFKANKDYMDKMDWQKVGTSTAIPMLHAYYNGDSEAAYQHFTGARKQHLRGLNRSSREMDSQINSMRQGLDQY